MDYVQPLLLRRRLMSGKRRRYGLPDGFRPCLYIEGTGTQSISTGIPIFNRSRYGDFDIELKINFSSTSYYYNTLWDTTLNADRYESWIYGNKQWQCRIPSGSLAVKTSTEPHVDYVFHCWSASGYWNCQIDDGTIHRAEIFSENWGGVFGLWRSTADNTFGKFKLYYARLRSNGNLVFDGVPALDQTGKPCLFDRVSGNTFYSTYEDFLYKLA